MEIKIKESVAKLIMDTELFLENIREMTSISEAVYFSLVLKENKLKSDLQEYSNFICETIDWVVFLDNIQEMKMKEIIFDIYRVNIKELDYYKLALRNGSSLYFEKEESTEEAFLLISNHVERKYMLNHGIDRFLSSKIYSFPTLDIEAKDLNT